MLDPEFVRELAQAYVDQLTSPQEPPLPRAVPIEPDETLESLAGELMGITDPWGQLVKTIQNLLNTVWTTFSEYVLSGVKGFIDWLLQQLSTVLSGIADALKNVAAGVTEAGAAVMGFVNAILRFPDWFPQWFSEYIAKPISDAIGFLAQKLWDLLPDWLKSAITAIKNALENLVKGLQGFPGWFSENIAKPISDAIRWLADQIGKLVPDWLKNALAAIQGALDSLVKGLQEFLKDPLGFMQRGFSWLAEQIWKLLPGWLKDFITWLHKALQDAWSAITGWFNWLWSEAQKFAKDPLGYLGNLVSWIGQSIWNILPDWLKGFFAWLGERIEDIKLGFDWLVGGLAEFAKDPLKFIKEKVAEPLAKLLQTLSDIVGSGISALAKALADAGQGLAGALHGAFFGFAMSASNWVLGVINEMLGWGKSIAESAGSTMAEFLANIVQVFYGQTREKIKKEFPAAVLAGKGGGELDLFIRTIIPSMALTIGSIMIPGSLYFLAHLSGSWRDHFESTLKELGTVGRWLLAVWGALNQFLYFTAENVTDLLGVIAAGGILTMQRGFMTPIVYPATAMWREFFNAIGLGDVPIAMPSEADVRTMFHRSLATNWAPIMAEKMAMTWKFYGYPEWWYIYYLNSTKKMAEIVMSTAPIYSPGAASTTVSLEGVQVERINPPPPYVPVTDRFGTERKLPTSPVYFLPSASDLARMMVRDMFATLDDFTRAMLMHGVVPDIAYLYYMFHFRYPPTERLWDFFWRASSGLAWYVPSPDVYAEAVQEAKKIGAKAPVAPVDLNMAGGKVPDVLWRALSTYMKWYDYARFAWIDGFTSDNWIMIDTGADLPGRVDLRWMTKWGLFDLLASKGATYTSPVQSFLKVVEASPANVLVSMDLTNLSRMIQATGMHPALVPVTAVAETINALTEERTLVRTGFIDLFRLGIVDYNSLDNLMARMVVASFKVAYLDVATGAWKEGWVNYPVQYLPPERRLLALRAAIDRVTRAYRTIERAVIGAYYDHLLTPEEAAKSAAEAVKALSPALEKTTEAISGTRVGLSLDAEYLSSLLAAYASLVPVRNLRRVRFIVNRVLGWIVYRVAYGWFTADDAKAIAEEMAKIARFSDQEKEAIKSILELMTKVTRREAHREYIPTPSMLATIAEYVPAARALFDKVVKARDIPAEWVPVWKQYVALRPIVDEVRNVIAQVMQLYTEFLIKPEDFKKFLETLGKFGYEADEIGLIVDRANARRWREAWRDLVGTPRQLVTMAEYVPEARKLALAEVRKRIEALPIPEADKQFLLKMWEDYIRIRPVYDQVEAEVTELINDYARGVIDDAFLDWALTELRKWGIDEYEADAIKFIATMRRRRYELTRRAR